MELTVRMSGGSRRLVERNMQTRLTALPEKLPQLHGDLLTPHLGRLVGGFVTNLSFVGWASATKWRTAG